MSKFTAPLMHSWHMGSTHHASTHTHTTETFVSLWNEGLLYGYKKSVWITWSQELTAWLTSGSAEYRFSARYFLRNGTCYWLWGWECEIMGNSPESFDPAPSVLHLCEPLNKQEPGTRFVTDVDVKQTVTSYLLTFHTDFFYAGIQTLLPRWENWRTVNIDTA